MTAEINELFEEGITRSRELADAADEAMNAIDALAKQAEQVAQKVEEEGREACQHMRELVSKLEHAEGELDAGRVEAEGALQALSGKAGDLKDEAGDLLQRVKSSLGELESRTSQLDGALDADMTTAQHDFQELAQETHDAEVHLQEQVQQAATAIAALRTAVEDAREELAHKQDAWSTAAQALEATVHEQTAAWAAGLQGLLERQAGAMVEMANSMVDDHNQAMEAIRHRFEDQAPQELTAALQPVEHALEHLGQSAAQHGQALISEATELEQWTQQALPVLETVHAALEAAGGLE